MSKRINSRAKGCRGERQARDYLIHLGFGTREDTRRGQQFAGGGDSPDVVCAALPGVHLEIKNTATIGLGTKELTEACEQASRDAHDNQRWAVLWKGARQSWRLSYRAFPPYVISTVCGDVDVRAALTELSKNP